MGTSKKTIVLTIALKKRLLKSLQSGQLILEHYPEFFSEPSIADIDISFLTEEEKAVLLKIARNSNNY